MLVTRRLDGPHPSGKKFSVYYEIFPKSFHFPRRFCHVKGAAWAATHWWAECTVEYDGMAYHHYKHDITALTLGGLVRKVSDKSEEVWFETLGSDDKEWWA